MAIMTLMKKNYAFIFIRDRGLVVVSGDVDILALTKGYGIVCGPSRMTDVRSS